VGNVANAVLRALGGHPDVPPFFMYSEVLQDAVLELMDEGKILLVNLSKGKIGEMNAHMLGLILISRLQAAILRRAHQPAATRRPFYLYVDEFQNFTTDTFISLLSESRKYGLGVHLTNQYLAQLPPTIKDAVLGNVGSLISFEVGAEDAEILCHEFDPVTVADFMGLPRFNFYIKLMVNGKTSAPFSGMSLPPLPPPVGAVSEASVIDLSRLAYGTPRLLAEQRIATHLE